MTRSLLALALLIPLSTHPALARDRGTVTIHSGHSCCEDPARWAARHDLRDARFAITTEDGDACMLLTRSVVAVQLSDRAFHKIDRNLRDKDFDNDADDDGSIIGSAIKHAVLGAVRDLLDHSAECRIRDIRDMSYERGRIVIVTDDGDRLFDGLDINDEDMLGSFSERDARAFVREFRRAKAAQR